MGDSQSSGNPCSKFQIDQRRIQGDNRFETFVNFQFFSNTHPTLECLTMVFIQDC
jgi:hypothetical protein